MDTNLPGLDPIIRARTVFLRREAIGAGYDDQAIARMVRRGQWVRIRTGAFVEQQTWESADARERHVLRAVAVAHAADLKQLGGNEPAEQRVILSHVTSAVLWGGPTYGLDLDHVHVTREDRKGGRNHAGVRRHRSAVPRSDIRLTRGLRHTAPARVVLEILSLAGLEPALCIANELVRKGLTTRDEIAAFALTADKWPGTLAATLLVRLVDGRRESVGETRFQLLCFRHSLPAGVPQYDVRAHGVFLGRVDVAYPEHGVFVEFDGRGKYFDLRRPGESVADVIVREKTRQERICAATGWECIRITWADLSRPERTARRIAEALERGRIRMALMNRASS